MHSLVRRYLKTAIAFLGVGLALGGWMMIQREFRGRAPSAYLTSAHTHAIFVGFVMMMILGVALWLFPRPEKGDTVYRPGLVSAAWWLVTTGTGARILGELLHLRTRSIWLSWFVAFAGLAQILGIGTFFYTMWSRIRPLGSQVREDRGERF